MVSKDQREFPKFAYAVLKGLGQAVITEPDMFVLALSAVTPRKTSRALALWFLARRADRYAEFFDSKLTLLSRVIVESNPRGTDG